MKVRHGHIETSSRRTGIVVPAIAITRYWYRDAR